MKQRKNRKPKFNALTSHRFRGVSTGQMPGRVLWDRTRGFDRALVPNAEREGNIDSGPGKLWCANGIVLSIEGVEFPIAVPFRCEIDGLVHYAATGGKCLWVRCHATYISFKGKRPTDAEVTCLACLSEGPLT